MKLEIFCVIFIVQTEFEVHNRLWLDRENRSDKMMSKRPCEFMTGHPEFRDAPAKVQYAILSSKKGKVAIDTLWDIHDWKLSHTRELLEIMHHNGEGAVGLKADILDYRALQQAKLF